MFGFTIPAFKMCVCVHRIQTHSSPKRCFNKTQKYRYPRTVDALGVFLNTLQKQTPDSTQSVFNDSIFNDLIFNDANTIFNDSI